MGAAGYTCPDCMRWFPTAEARRQHQEDRHEGQSVPKPGGL